MNTKLQIQEIVTLQLHYSCLGVLAFIVESLSFVVTLTITTKFNTRGIIMN